MAAKKEGVALGASNAMAAKKEGVQPHHTQGMLPEDGALVGAVANRVQLHFPPGLGLGLARPLPPPLQRLGSAPTSDTEGPPD